MLKIRVDFSSLVRKGLKSNTDDFMIALINGYQGSGKSYYGIYKLEREFKGRVVYTNIHSYHSSSLEVRYFDKLEEIYDNHDIGAVFLIDELSKKFVKDSKIDLRFYSWLQQSRKHKRYVFLITQEYIQVPNWLRGIAILSYTTRKIPLTSFLITTLGAPVLDSDTYEWGIQEQALLFYKRNKCIAELYDTNELINAL